MDTSVRNGITPYVMKVRSYDDRIELLKKYENEDDVSVLTVQKRGCVMYEEKKSIKSLSNIDANWMPILGVVGIMNISAYLFLVVVVKGQKAEESDEPIHSITETRLICFDSKIQ